MNGNPPIYNIGKTSNYPQNPPAGKDNPETPKFALIVAVIVLVLAGGFYWFSGQGKDNVSKFFILRSATATVDSSNVPSSLYGTIAAINPVGSIIVRAGERQVIPEGSLRTIGVPDEATIQKVKPIETDENGDAVSVSFEDADFEDLSVGQRVSLQADLDVDISKEDNFNATFITVITGDF